LLYSGQINDDDDDDDKLKTASKYRAVAVLEKKIFWRGGWPLITWEATTAKRN